MSMILDGRTMLTKELVKMSFLDLDLQDEVSFTPLAKDT